MDRALCVLLSLWIVRTNIWPTKCACVNLEFAVSFLGCSAASFFSLWITLKFSIFVQGLSIHNLRFSRFDEMICMREKLSSFHNFRTIPLFTLPALRDSGPDWAQSLDILFGHFPAQEQQIRSVVHRKSAAYYRPVQFSAPNPVSPLARFRPSIQRVSPWSNRSGSLTIRCRLCDELPFSVVPSRCLTEKEFDKR